MGAMGTEGLVLLALKHCSLVSFSLGPSLQVYWSKWDGMGWDFTMRSHWLNSRHPGCHCIIVCKVFYFLSFFPLLLCSPFLTEIL